MKQQHEVDFSDDRERFIWALRGLEMNGFPVSFPPGFLEELSAHLSRCGFMHVSEVENVINKFVDTPYTAMSSLPKQQIHYQPPLRGSDNALNATGRWIPIDQPIEQPVVSLVDQLTPEEKAVLLEQLKQEVE